MAKEITQKDSWDDSITSKYSESQIEVISRTIAPGLTKDELEIFLHNCVRTGLCPFSKQIYAIKRGGKMCIQTGIDGFRVIAERSGKYAPGKDTEFIYNDKGFLQGAKVYVKKMTTDGTWHDISAIALMQEYNANQGLWKKMAHVMIEKCAESRALRRAFPSDLSGLYTKDEMSQAESEDIAVEAIKEPLEPIISNDTWKALDEYLNGYDDLRVKLRKLCKIDDLRNIKESQLEACRTYAKKYVQKIKDANDDSEE